ncbi:MAG: hypothetical protein ABI651_05915 [Verrucomicrobiota bacterium]
MNIQHDLVVLYEEWRVLSDEEAHAINFAGWTQVNQCQDAKRELQDKIIQAADMLKKDARCQDSDRKQIACEIRERLVHLIALELRNQELLNTQRGKAQKQKEILDKSQQNLRHVHRAYVSARHPIWNSYS